ncbi:unnamed protein product [Adineta ricciae]|uniref:Arylesterase n=1 Tax=Adineta ricciae TaxID=249248 RepID=A0A813Q4U1_ADIRI|nr:unnamed protein product [Adineta ricciae]
MIKSVLVWSCVVLPLAFIVKLLLDTGTFRHIETKGLTQCQLMVPPNGEGQAFEDFAIDYEKGVAYMPGDNRVWWHTLNISLASQSKRGKMFRLDLESETFSQYELVNYPYEHFHPLGIGLLKRQNNQLFLTNYRVVDGEVVGTVEIFKTSASNEKQVKWIDSVVHPLFTMPDDVLPIDENTFYVSNVYHYRADKSPYLHLFETLGRRPWTDVLLCSKTNEWQCKIIIDSMATSNGIAASLDFQTVFIAFTADKSIRVYKYNSENNLLTYTQSLYVEFFPDNLIVNDKDELIVAGHPKPLVFVQHEKDHHVRSPSEIVIFRNPTSNSTCESLLLTNGEILSASTVGATYKHKLLVGALCDHGILMCHDLF